MNVGLMSSATKTCNQQPVIALKGLPKMILEIVCAKVTHLMMEMVIVYVQVIKSPMTVEFVPVLETRLWSTMSVPVLETRLWSIMSALALETRL